MEGIRQTPRDMERECLGTIARVCGEMQRLAMEEDEDTLDIQFDFLRTQMGRLKYIRKTYFKGRTGKRWDA